MEGLAINLPEFLKPKDIQKILQISRGTTYTLLNQKLFPVKTIRGQKRIPRDPFLKWLDAQ